MASPHRPTATALLALFVVTVLLSGAVEAQLGPTAAGSPGPATSSGSPGPASSAGAPGPSSGTEDCITVLSNAFDCLSYVEEGSNLTVPEKPCCGEIKQVVNTRPDCLCQMLVKNNSLGIEFDVKKALKLPSVCHLKTPDVSLCSLFGIPVGAPAQSPSGSESSPPGASPAGTPGLATTRCHLSSMASLLAVAIAFVFTF